MCTTAPPDPECASPLHRDRDFGGKIRKKWEKEEKRHGETLIGQLGKEGHPAECPHHPLGALPSTVCGNEKETKFWISLI